MSLTRRDQSRWREACCMGELKVSPAGAARWKKSSIGGMLVHDPLDRPSAAATLRITADVAEEFADRARWRAEGHCRTHLVVAEDIAGADDHRNGPR